MRQVLIDYARMQQSQKRGGANGFVAACVEIPDDGSSTQGFEVVELEDALRRLEAVDPRAARVVELRFFGGLTVDETARVMELGRTSVEESWRVARAWLLSRLHATGRA
jgi:RNA polymerase sigma factor (TIGR02999 family)